MEIIFDKDKYCQVYKELVENPDNRASIKNFSKKYDYNIVGAAIRLHKKLICSDNASVYNLTATSNNKIELKSGVPDKEPVVLKVRIQDSYRKFFYFCEKNTQGIEEFGLTKNWCGQFNKILKIHVYEVNKHEYSKT
jgi:hypothetical protein